MVMELLLPRNGVDPSSFNPTLAAPLICAIILALRQTRPRKLAAVSCIALDTWEYQGDLSGRSLHLPNALATMTIDRCGRGFWKTARPGLMEGTLHRIYGSEQTIYHCKIARQLKQRYFYSGSVKCFQGTV